MEARVNLGLTIFLVLRVEEAILVATPVETPGLALSEGLELIDLGSNQAAPSVQANNFKFGWRQALILNLNLVEGFKIK